MARRGTKKSDPMKTPIRYCIPISIGSFLVGMHLAVKSTYYSHFLLERLPRKIPGELVSQIHRDLMSLEPRKVLPDWNDYPFVDKVKKLLELGDRVKVLGGLNKVLETDAPISFSWHVDKFDQSMLDEMFLGCCADVPKSQITHLVPFREVYHVVVDHSTPYRDGYFVTRKEKSFLVPAMQGWEEVAVAKVLKDLNLESSEVCFVDGARDIFLRQHLVLQGWLHNPSHEWHGCCLRVGPRSYID